MILWSLPDGSTAAGAEPAWARGRQWVALAGGYGHALGGHGGNADADRVQYVPVLPRWGTAVTDVLGGERWYRGSMDLVVEGLLLFEVEPRGGFAGGVTIGGRYYFRAAVPVTPFVVLGIGIAGLDLDLEGLPNGVAFPMFAGVGAQLPVSRHLAITAEGRFQHISNANIYDHNRSLNDGVALMGVTLFLP